MYLLEKDFYSKAQPIFKNMLDYETTVRVAFNDKTAPCEMYADDLKNPQSACFIMNWGGYKPCYFSGRYNQTFVYSCLEHLLASPKFSPIFAEIELLNEIDKLLSEFRAELFCNYGEGHKHERRKRLYYKLNIEKFYKNKVIEAPENYELVLNTEKENERMVLLCDGKEAGHCNGSYKPEVEEINLDIFIEDEHRKKGLGTLICTKLIEYHLSQNREYITWGCWDINGPSIKLGEKLGFELIREDDILFC